MNTYYNRENLSWAAGIFDGEGHIACRSKRGQRKLKGLDISIQIKQNEDSNCFAPEMLERFSEIFQIGKIQGPYLGKSNYHYSWECHTYEHCQFVISSIWFQLGIVKKEQASEALKLYLKHYPYDWHNLRRDLKDNPPHGTAYLYQKGCRCDDCRVGWRRYAKGETSFR